MLKSLELFGFKSFADRTTFEFAEGVTGVVGPNGSGKSNVVDAIKWILGDQSAKSLRGKEMADVIFNGSASRKPSGFAEASLTFDNTTGYLPVDAAEVKIGRRLYRSGDSEYLLNNAVVRLKDIRELILGSGAGSAAYCIIEQGRVDQVLQANPTTRRVVFEEAAGISRYKLRRVEATRRLERVDQNLVRLTDIVDQVEARLDATRSQAAKAAKYRELSTELREWWTGLAADDFRRACSELAQIDAALAEQRETLTGLDRQSAELDRQLGEIDTASSGVDDQLRGEERRRGTAREAIARHESAIRHHSTQAEELSVEIDRLRRQRHVLRAQVEAVGSELHDSDQRLRQFEAQFSARKQAVGQHEQSITELKNQLTASRRAIEARREECAALTEQRTSITHELAALRSRRESTHTALETAANRHDRIQQSLAETEAQLAVFQQSVDEAEHAVADAQTRIEEHQQARRQLIGQQAAAEQRLADWREQRSAKLARLHVLEDLDERLEGLSVGVQEVLRRAADADQKPWNLIRGSVGELLEAELDDAPLLEVALGPRVQLLVIDELAPLIDYLNSAMAEVAGRVGFLEVVSGESPVSGQESRVQSPKSGVRSPESEAAKAHGPRPVGTEEPLDAAAPTSNAAGATGSASASAVERPIDLMGHAGILCRADHLVSHSTIPGLPQQLLAGTWIVETLDLARRMSSGVGAGQRFVTLQGELVEADGTLFVGNVANEVAVISRKSELRQLRQALRILNGRITTAENEIADLNESLAEFDTDLQTLRAVLEEQRDQLAQRRSALAAGEAESQRRKIEADEIAFQIAHLHEQQQEIDRQIAAAMQSRDDLEATVTSLAAGIEDDEVVHREVGGQLDELRQAMKSEQLELAKHEERLAALRTNQDRLLADHEDRIRQRDEASLHLQAAQRKRREMIRAILFARSQLAQRYLEADALDRTAKRLLQHRDRLRHRRRQFQREQDKAREQHRKLSRALHETEIHTRDLRHQVASLESRIREEYQAELSELAAEGVSAYRLLVGKGAERVRSEPRPLGSDPSDEEPLINVPCSDAQLPVFEDVRPEIESRVERLRRRIKNLGAINTDSLQDLDELQSQYDTLSGQLADLQEAKAALEDIIRRINVESRRMFLETFEAIRGHFRELFRKLFGGGEGDIILEDPDDVLECGIDIVARPPGKELRSITLLSGGEKTLTAVALLFAMFRSKPGPYCILDEVDASLDEANVDRYKRVLLEFRDATQFIVITHRKPTMTVADVLYGVTMEQAGVSKRLTVRFEDVTEDGHFHTRSAAA